MSGVLKWTATPPGLLTACPSSAGIHWLHVNCQSAQMKVVPGLVPVQTLQVSGLSGAGAIPGHYRHPHVTVITAKGASPGG